MEDHDDEPGEDGRAAAARRPETGACCAGTRAPGTRVPTNIMTFSNQGKTGHLNLSVFGGVL